MPRRDRRALSPPAYGQARFAGAFDRGRHGTKNSCAEVITSHIVSAEIFLGPRGGWPSIHPRWPRVFHGHDAWWPRMCIRRAWVLVPVRCQRRPALLRKIGLPLSWLAVYSLITSFADQFQKKNDASWPFSSKASSMPSPKKPKSPTKPTGRAPGKTTATPAAQCAWSWQRFRCGPEPGCRLTLGAHWPRCDGKTSGIGTPQTNDVNGDAIHVTTINGDMSALCCSLLLLAPLMYIGRAWSSRRRRMAAVPTKSKMSPRGSPRPRRRHTAAVSTAAVSTKSKTAPRLEEAAEPESLTANNSTHKVYPWSPAAEHAAAAEEVDRRWRLVREEAAKIATPPPGSPSRSRLPLLASRLPSFSDLAKELTKPPELSAPVAVQPDAPMPPCSSGCTHRWVKEHLPPLLAAKQVTCMAAYGGTYCT